MMGLGAPDLPPMDMNFGMDSAHDLNDVKLSVPDMAASSNGLSFSAAPVNAPALSKPMEFDLGALSLDLPGQDDEDTARDPIPVAVTGPAPLMDDSQMTGDPLETKLQLAMEFHEIGDKDGARALIREVVAEADGAMKAKAQRMLADLG
jgi:pilus assembly protein FimV